MVRPYLHVIGRIIQRSGGAEVQDGAVFALQRDGRERANEVNIFGLDRSRLLNCSDFPEYGIRDVCTVIPFHDVGPACLQ